MGKNYKKQARKLLKELQDKNHAHLQVSRDVRELREAAHWYWKEDFIKCSRIFFPLQNRLIVEPLMGTEEYKNGERKPEASLDEPQEEKPAKGEVLTFEDLFGPEGDTSETEAPRDPDGYLLSESPDEYLTR